MSVPSHAAISENSNNTDYVQFQVRKLPWKRVLDGLKEKHVETGLEYSTQLSMLGPAHEDVAFSPILSPRLAFKYVPLAHGKGSALWRAEDAMTSE